MSLFGLDTRWLALHGAEKRLHCKSGETGGLRTSLEQRIQVKLIRMKLPPTSINTLPFIYSVLVWGV